MSRTSRVPYHQNVYDLLQIEPSECPIAARLIAEHEARYGPLPESVREWYLLPVETQRRICPHYDFDLTDLLAQLAQLNCDGFLTGTMPLPNDEDICISVELNGADDDPPSEFLNAWTRWDGGTFSSLLWGCVIYNSPYWAASLDQLYNNSIRGNFEKLVWLRTPDEPFAVPIIDFLTEQFGEPERAARPGDVTTYIYRPEGGTIRVTADDPAHPDPLSAWWVHADTPERLAEFARHLLPWGTLGVTLRADTEPARDVLHRARTGAPN